MAHTRELELVTRRRYRKSCTVCQFLKKTPHFRIRLMQSSYFNQNGTESIAQLYHEFSPPFSLSNVYFHLRTHQSADRQRIRDIAAKKAGYVRDPALAGAAAAIEGAVSSQGEHEQVLDEFIRYGRSMLLAQEMPITATNLINAIKTKADIEKNTKDRRLDMVKAFFTGGEKDKQDGPKTNEQPSGAAGQG